MSTQTTGSDASVAQSDGIVAELELDHESLPLRPTLQRVASGRIELEYWSELEDGRTMVFFGAEAVPFDVFERALEADPTIAEPTVIDHYPRKRVYRARLTEEAVRFTTLITAAGGRIRDLSSGHRGWVARLRFPDRDGLVAFNRSCRQRSISSQVNHIRLAKPNETTVVGLTRKQEELLTVAYDEGYFDVPRGISQDELAATLGISKSAVSQRLRRALNELCETSL